MSKVVDMTGQTFGRLTVIERAQRPAYNVDQCAWWRCRCECGTLCDVSAKSLRMGWTRSCGCIRSERMRNMQKQQCEARIHRAREAVNEF